ncbi:hypothetical protein U8C35_07720 [Sinorhizobium medicae]|uniref:hypothetical protein n=1 Tax=Sinorhizobium medicae TaxID=110321 RepID=UPI002AF6A698|nr:hypothetical protein [Sinorhizobium medicae]WQO60299.1 hypothetical protein U8C35_07720 [Sinorhizobium medicae]
MTPWTWWAGELDDDVYALAEATTKEEVIRRASIGMKPSDQFRIVEARSSEAMKYEGQDFVPFLRTRNEEIVTIGPVAVKGGAA